MKKEQTGNALSIVSNLYHYYRPPSTTSTYSTLDLSSLMLCRLASVREYRKKEKNTHKKKFFFLLLYESYYYISVCFSVGYTAVDFRSARFSNERVIFAITCGWTSSAHERCQLAIIIERRGEHGMGPLFVVASHHHCCDVTFSPPFPEFLDVGSQRFAIKSAARRI